MLSGAGLYVSGHPTLALPINGRGKNKKGVGSDPGAFFFVLPKMLTLFECLRFDNFGNCSGQESVCPGPVPRRFS